MIKLTNCLHNSQMIAHIIPEMLLTTLKFHYTTLQYIIINTTCVRSLDILEGRNTSPRTLSADVCFWRCSSDTPATIVHPGNWQLLARAKTPRAGSKPHGGSAWSLLSSHLPHGAGCRLWSNVEGLQETWPMMDDERLSHQSFYRWACGYSCCCPPFYLFLQQVERLARLNIDG